MSLKNKVIIILGNIRFDSPFEATSLFLARNLAKHNQVYFVEYPLTYKDYWQYKKEGKLKSREGKFSLTSDGLVNSSTPGLKFVVSPLLMPINFLPEGSIFRAALKLNEQLVINRIKKLVKSIGAKNKFIFINSFNFHLPGVGEHINPALNVYHCVDPMIIPYDMKHGIVSEQQLVEKSDMVVCTSKELYEQKRLINPKTYFVPNAADLSHCSKALDEQLPVHEQLTNIPKPIIGYLGAIERRIDHELMVKVAEANPDKSFVFAGPVWKDHFTERFLNTPNIYLTGLVEYAQVPNMLKGFDVAIIPFKKDDVSNTIFPLKLFEYLGAGKPVVATNFNPDLKDYTRETVLYCDTAEEFTEAIKDALKNTKLDAIKARLEVAGENTWEKRADQLGLLMAAQLPKA